MKEMVKRIWDCNNLADRNEKVQKSKIKRRKGTNGNGDLVAGNKTNFTDTKSNSLDIDFSRTRLQRPINSLASHRDTRFSLSLNSKRSVH